MLWIARGLRCIRWEGRSVKCVRPRPGPDSTNNGIDLLVCEHAARALDEGWHRGSGYAISCRLADGGIVGNGEENGIGQRDRRSSGAVVSMASRAILCVKHIEIHNLVRWNFLRARSRPAR
jgi:hypothetical protein